MQNPIIHYYFDFIFNTIHKRLFIIKPGMVILPRFSIYVIEKFKPNLPASAWLGTANAPHSIVKVHNLNILGPCNVGFENTPNHLSIFEKETQIVFTLNKIDFTYGRGWGLIEVLDTNLVQKV